MEAHKKPPEWPGTDEKIVVVEMLRDPSSPHWKKCREYVRKHVGIHANGIPANEWDDITQDILIRICLGLHAFQHSSMLTTWITQILLNYLVDVRRKYVRQGVHTVSLTNFTDEGGHEGSAFPLYSAETVESTILNQETSGEAVAALVEFLSVHAHTERNERILEMVLFEGFTCEAAAKEVGCSGPVASHVVRSAQEYVRKKLGHPKPPKPRKSQQNE